MSKRKVTASIFKLVLPVLVVAFSLYASGFAMKSSMAFLTAMARSTSNLIQTGAFCTEGVKWVSEVVESHQGLRKNDTPITDPARINPDAVLGVNDNQFFSLGKGGSITVKYQYPILDQSGPDVAFEVFETTFGSRAGYPEELGKVEVSQDGSTWFELPNRVTSKQASTTFDISPLSLSWIQYVRITDVSDFGPHAFDADGIDIDAIKAIHGSCDNQVANRIVSGQKYHDTNTNGQVDQGEAGLENWTILAATKIWESDVQALNTPAVATPVLSTGTSYIARVTGTYDANDNITADAKYSVRLPNTAWTDPVQNYGGYGPTLLDLQIDGASPAWGSYNADHVYWTVLTGADAAKSFEISDLNNGSNNSGNLHVELFQVIAQDTTDATGNYALVIPELTETVYIFEAMQTGWSQTQPGAVNYYYTFEATDRDANFDFGNVQSVISSPQVSNVTVCKVDNNQQPLTDWRMVLRQSAAVASINVPSTGATVTTPTLIAGNYALLTTGTYNYGTPDMIADGANSYRPAYVPCNAGGPWVNGEVGCMNNYLSVSQDLTGPAPFDAAGWGGTYNPAHVYAQGKNLASEGTLSFKIWDDQYADNEGSLTLTAYPGWVQDTATNGCTTFADVPYGSYTLEEIGQNGWEYASGDQGTVTIDSASENFTLVNTQSATNTAPISSITVSSSPTKQIENRIVNGGFEADLGGWSAVGDVAVVTGVENDVTPSDTKMVRIGRTTSPGKSADVNILSQNVSNAESGVRSLGFWYNFLTYEPGEGFDEPGFMVFVGDKMVHQVWASDVDVDNDSSTLDATGWRFLSIDLTDVTDPTLSLAYYAGNSGDLGYQSFVYVDNVTTNEAAVNHSAIFTLDGTDDESVASVHYSYLVNGAPVTGSGLPGYTFSINQQPDNGQIEYWAVDNDGLIETHKSFHVMFDDQAPAAITNLSANNDANGDYTLTWSAPADVNPYGVNQAAEYDIRYATSAEELTAGNWETLSKPIIKNIDGLPGGNLRAPLVSGNSEVYSVHVNAVEIEGVPQAATYYFAVRSRDRARNLSDLSNVASDGETATTVEHQLGDVIINEIMWMGSDGAATDEWIELRNQTSVAIDLSNWQVEGLGTSGSPVITLPGGATLPANGYYLIANSAAASSALLSEPQFVTSLVELANGGEQLILKTAAAAVIDQTPAGVWPAGVNSTLKRSLERNNQPGDGTDAANWHSCDSASCEDARVLYWDSVGNNYGTPGAANLSFDEAQIGSQVSLAQADPDHAQFTLDGVQQFTSAQYLIEYTHQVDGQDVTEALTGTLTFAVGTRTQQSDSLYLGVCSTGQESCVSHSPVTHLKITVVLTGAGVPDRTLTATLE